MIETVQERQKGAYNFENYYENLCALQDTCPIPAVKAHLHEGILDINGDRIRQQDWLPIFNSIRINKSLKFIAVRSYFQLNLDEAIPEKKAKIMRSRIPVIRTKEMTVGLSKSIRDCLASTENLECLELQGIHLRESHISIIGQGIMKNKTLKHLSLESCRVGDSGLKLLCAAMKLAGNITTLNLTSCSLSPAGIWALADLIKFQAMSRHNEAWKESLRYRWANFDTMIGLRRMTLNKNLSICDEGALLLAESLKDDLWVKAIDLQECGLTSNAVRGFLKVLKFNSTLIVLDLRRNPLIDRDLLKSVTEQVLINGYGKEIEYQWLRVEDTTNNFHENYDRHPRSYYDGPTKPLEPESRPAFKPAGKLRSRSANSIDRRSLDKNNDEYHIKSQRSSSRGMGASTTSKGQPWRTAIRASRYKGYPPDHVPGKNNLEEHYETASLPKQKDKKSDSLHNHSTLKLAMNIKKKPIIIVNTARSTTDDEKSSSVVSPLIHGVSYHPPVPESVKELKTEVFHLRTQLEKYKDEKNEIDQKLKEMYNENSRLRNTVKLMSKTHSVIAKKSEKSSLLQDEAILEYIESSFQQFNAFLDMLRQSGFAKIVTTAGMDNFTTIGEIRERIIPPHNIPLNESSGTSLSSIKPLDIPPNESTTSLRGDKRNAVEMENAKGNKYFPPNTFKTNGKNIPDSSSTTKVFENGIDENIKHDFVAEPSCVDDKTALEFVGWKDYVADKAAGTVVHRTGDGGDEAAIDIAAEPLSWNNYGKGKESKKVFVPSNEVGSGDFQVDDPIEELGWKKYPPSQLPNNHHFAGDQDHVEKIIDENFRESDKPNYGKESPKSIDEIAEISERIMSNYDEPNSDRGLSLSITKPSVKLVNHFTALPDLNVEDIDSCTDDSENGSANDLAVDYQYGQQGSLDAAMELSTDTSFNYGN